LTTLENVKNVSRILNEVKEALLSNKLSKGRGYLAPSL
jgi:hypothetical protein